MKGSIFVIKQYEFLNLLTQRRRKILIKKAFLLSLILHLLFFLVFSLSFSRVKTKVTLKSEEILVINADYVPFSKEESHTEIKEERKEVVENNVSKTVKNTEETKERKNDFTMRERRRVDKGWHAEIEKRFKIRNLEKIVISKGIDDIKKHLKWDQKESQVSSSPTNYIKLLAILIRSHWSIPEDLGHKCYDKSVEWEIAIDDAGKIKEVNLVRSSGYSDCDFYAKEAILKTKQFPLPPKELGDRIIIEFRP